MPNHVTNLIFFRGNQSDINDLLKNVKGERYDFEIDSFYPMPKALKNTSSPARIVSNEEVKLWNKKKREGKLTDWELMCQPMTERRSNELIKKYGANNWYDWALNNWGTKWGAYEVNSYEDNSFQFQTAWDTPVNAMKVLSRLHPKVEIFVRYFDEDFGANVGEYTLLGGHIQNMNRPKDCSEEAYLLAIDIEGGDSYYTDDLLDIDPDEDINTAYYRACFKMAHKNDIVFEDFPDNVLNSLLELAVADEQYEKAGMIKQYLENKPTK